MANFLKNATVRFFIYASAIPAFLFHALVLSGCTSNSPGIAGLFLLKFAPLNNNGTVVNSEVRLGYFGICFVSGQTAACQSSTAVNSTALSIQAKQSNNFAFDVLPLALSLQTKFKICLLVVSGVLLLLGLLSYILFKHSLRLTQTVAVQRNSPRLHLLAVIGLTMAVGSGFASAFAANLSTLLLRDIIVDLPSAGISVDDGRSLLALQWLAVASTAIIWLGVFHSWSGRSRTGSFPGDIEKASLPSFPPPPPPPPLQKSALIGF